MQVQNSTALYGMIINGITVRPIKLWNRKTTVRIMFWFKVSPMNMQHINCAVYTEPFHLITRIFSSQYLCNPMSRTFDISYFEFCNLLDQIIQVWNIKVFYHFHYFEFTFTVSLRFWNNVYSSFKILK